MRFQDAAPDARAVVYQGIQRDPLVARVADDLAAATPAERWLARAVMNGERTDPDGWRRMFPGLFGDSAPVPMRDRAERLLEACLQVAERGEQARSQYRGAIVEELTSKLLTKPSRTPGGAVRRERRILVDGVRAEIHPYDVTLERPERPAVFDCKWGARGIGPDVLNQLDDAYRHATDEGADLETALVVFDARRSCEIRLARETTPHDTTELFALESLDELGTERRGARAAVSKPGRDVTAARWRRRNE